MQVKKWLGTALALTFALGCLSGCGGKLPEGFSRDEVVAQAKAASQLLEEEDYQGLVACWRPDLRDDQLEEKLRQAWEGLGGPELGERSEYTAEEAVGREDDGGEPYVVVLLIAKYERGKVQYTISLDKEGQLVGFYLK